MPDEGVQGLSVGDEAPEDEKVEVGVEKDGYELGSALKMLRR